MHVGRGGAAVCSIEAVCKAVEVVDYAKKGNYMTTPKTTIQWTSLCRNYPGHRAYVNQTGNLTAKYAEGHRGEINGYVLITFLYILRSYFPCQKVQDRNI